MAQHPSTTIPGGQPPVPQKPQLSSRASVARAVLGIAFEYYDFTIFAIFAPFFAAQFFVQESSTASTLSALLVFAVGFVFRPLGAVVFGWYADRKGRKGAMILAMSVTAGGSLLIGIAPTHDTIGGAAALLLTLARILQGFGHGGESAGSYAYASEVAPPNRRGLWSSTIPVSLTLGIFAATLLGALLTSVLDGEAMRTWGWRVPFLIGGALGLFALFLRRGLEESDAFETARKDQAVHGEGGFWNQMWRHRASILRVIGLTSGVTVAFYTWGVNGTSYAITAKGADANTALWAGLAAQLVYMMVLPLWGLLSDRNGRRPNFVIGSLALAALLFPLLHLIGSDGWRIFLSTAIALSLIGAAMSVDPAYFSELFPTRIRASGFSLPYALAIALFGGTAPYLNTLLADQNLAWVFTVYSIVMLVVTALTALSSPETAGKDLA